MFTSNCNPLIKKKQEGEGKKYSRRGTPDRLVLSKGRGKGLGVMLFLDHGHNIFNQSQVKKGR
jgi:hypothetical protein